MERAEIYIDKNNNLVLTMFDSINDEYESLTRKGESSYELIKSISQDSLKDIYLSSSDILTLKFRNVILNINDYKDTFYRRGLGPIREAYVNYENSLQHQNISNKVTRKNKYSKKRIIATGLAAISLLTVVLLKQNKKNNVVSATPNKEVVYNLEEDDIKKLSVTEQIVEEPKENKEVEEVFIEYSDRTNTEKARITKAYYNNIINKYANMYGLDPNLVLAIATQEQGIHKADNNTPATGLMQIEKSVWNNNSIKAYNFNTKSYEIVNINTESLKSLDYNIKVGCMILQNNLNNFNYNPLLAIQSYNMGYGSINKILDIYCKDTGKSREDVINNVNDCDWINYRNIIKLGDQNYLEHILSYYGNDCNIENIKPDGMKICLNVTNQERYIKK